jgi:ECF transporter S component (folate family)
MSIYNTETEWGIFGLKNSAEIRYMVLAAMFASVDIITTRMFFADAFFPTVPPNLVRFSLQFLCYGLAGWILGPGWTLGAAVTGDIVGALIRSGGFDPISPGITLVCALSGLMFGFVLYKRPPKLWRSILATGIYCMVIMWPLVPLVFHLWFGREFWPSLWSSLPWRAVLFIPYGVILFLVQKSLDRPLRKHFQ